MSARIRRSLQLFVIVLIASLISSGCQRFIAPAPTPTPQPQFNPVRGLSEIKCPFPVPNDADITCGKLEVPENYARIDSRKIELFTAIIHSRNENPRRDPIVLLSQDAGISPLDYIGYIGRGLGELLAERDLVYLEYRGLGISGPELDCPEFLDAYLQTWATALTPDQEAALFEEAIKTCRERLINAEIDPSYYTVNEMAADLSTLRLVLGYEQFNLLAGGFGAEIAFAMLRDYPQAVRSVSLFELSFPRPYLRSEMFAISLQGSLDLLFNRCLADEECRLAYPDLEGLLYGAVDQLNRKPAEVKVFFPSGLATVQITGNDFLLLIQTMLMSNQSISGIPKLVDEVAHGKVNNISDEMQRYRMQIPDEFVEGLSITAACAGLHASFLQTTPASRDVQQVIMEAVQEDAEVYTLMCPNWIGGHLVQPAEQPIRSEVPVLILQGEFTPDLSPDVVAELVSEMKNALHVVIPNMSYDVFSGESCAGLLIYEWLANTNTGLDTSCVNNTEAIKFYEPMK